MDGRCGSNVYEVNTSRWLWQFGRGKPRLGGLTIEETSDRQDAARKASDKRRKETRKGCNCDGSWLEIKYECDLYEYVPVQSSMYFVPKVCTRYVLFSLSTYSVHIGMYCTYKNIARHAFLCRMPVGNDTVYRWPVCGGAPTLNQCPYWCPTHMTLFWYVLSTYWYVPVCTIIPFLYRSVLRTYWYVPYHCQYVLNTLILYDRSRFQKLSRLASPSCLGCPLVPCIACNHHL